MDVSAILRRLEDLEQRVSDLSRPPLYYQATGFEMDPGLMNLQRAVAFSGETIASARVEIAGDICPRMVRCVEDQLDAAQDARHLAIHIDSRGGTFDSSLSIYRAISWHPALTKTVYMRSECSSAALIAAMAGDTRIAHSGTTIVLHMTAGEPSRGRRWTAADHAEAMRRQSALDRVMLSLIAERTGSSFEALSREASSESPSSLSWCLAHGLIDAVEEEIAEESA